MLYKTRLRDGTFSLTASVARATPDNVAISGTITPELVKIATVGMELAANRWNNRRHTGGAGTGSG